jgi:AcrR family transcriptional regulator
VPRPARTQAERRAASERRLLDAAATVIAERGTTSVSFAAIAEAAGCSHGLPGYLFGSKTGMLLALLQTALDRFRDEVVPAEVRGRGGLEAVLGVLRAFLDSLDRPLPYTRAIQVMIGEASGSAPELRDALNAHHATARGWLRDALIDGIERGEVRPGVDAGATATVLLGTLRGITTQVLLDPGAVDVAAVTAEVLDVTRRSLAVDPGGGPG